ncbi:MAG: response regulator transcription factor [Gallionella sp.]|nr:response regulator transcription factor [Gallionella sp.]
MNTLSVAIVEDDPNLLWHYCALIEAEPDMRLAGTATGVRDGLAMMERVSADVLLCDLGLPDGNGVDIVRFAVDRNAAIHVLVVTMFSDNDHVFHAIEAGAAGYLLKDAMPDQFAESIREVANGGCPINTGIARRLLRAFRPPPDASSAAVAASAGGNPLSARETEILELLAKGLGFGEVAKLLFISAHTVTAHVRNIYRKLAVNSRGEAVYEGLQMGIIS